MDTQLASLWNTAWQSLTDLAGSTAYASTVLQAFGSEQGVSPEDLEGLRQGLLAEGRLGLTLEEQAEGETLGWDPLTGVIRLEAALLAEGADPQLAQRRLVEEIGRAIDAQLNGGTGAWGQAGARTFANLLLGAATGEAAPSLSAPEAITLQDSSAQDSFTASSGSLLASDPESARLRYGLEGASATSQTVHGVVYDLSKAGAYGTLYLNSSTGQYRFQPRSDWQLNAQSSSGSDTFQLSVSDGASSTSTALVVNFSGSHEAPEQYVVIDDAAPVLTAEAQSLWEQALTNASQRLAELVSNPNRDALLNDVFGNAGTESATFEANKQALLDTISGL
ncbi:MAG: Ig-like domain-containing protein, partial [Synechococcaceae cyanobacterium]|nr:Ig-like domain-containing protein [Synechococcaceae cyanobacterium]